VPYNTELNLTWVIIRQRYDTKIQKM